jgi:tRNA A-37 threonylcarbamoyl transferase component Bud32
VGIERGDGPAPGERLGPYEIVRQVGQGGMATVYLARDLRHDRQVAIKILRPELSAMLGAERFLHEIRVTANLQHPHILPLFDSGSADGRLFCVLSYVDGESLRARLNREKQLPIEEAVRIAREVASALEYAHRHGVIHRDIKPENILLQDGTALVADFGIALALREAGGTRLTGTGLTMGTPQYMSPEQATADRQLDARSDVYSLAAVLYEMLTGEPPYTGPTAQAVIAKLLTEPPMRVKARRDTVPEALERAIGRALAKLPADRFPSAAEFGRALAVEPTVAGAAGTPRRWMASAAALVAAAIVVVALIELATRARSGQAPAPLATPVQATFTGNVQATAISRDGSRLALATRECDAESHCSVALSWQDLGGAGTLRVMDGLSGVYRISWSPDSRYLLFTGTNPAGRFGVFRIPALGGRLDFLGCCRGEFVRTADSVLLTPSRAPGSPVVIQLVTASDGRVRDSLVFARPGVTGRGGVPSPDGRWILVVMEHDTSAMLLLADRRGRVVDSLATGSMDFGLGPRFDPKGQGIVFRERDPAQPWWLGDRGHLVRTGFDSRSGRLSRPTVLVDWRDGLTAFDVAGDADETVVYLAGPMETSIKAMVRAGADTQYGTRTLMRATGALTGLITPDGHAVAVLRPVPGGDRQVVVIPFDGGGETPITPAGQLEEFEWFGDTRLLYAEEDSEHHVRLFARELAGGVRELGVVPGGFSCSWLRDGVVAAPMAGGRELLLVSLDGSRRRLRVSDSTIKVSYLFPEPGGASAITLGWNTTEDTIVVGRLRLADGRFARLAAKVAEGWSGGVWLPNGWAEVVLDEVIGRRALYRIDPDGGPLTRVGTLPHGNAMYRFSSDGRRAVASVYEPRGDVWILRNRSASGGTEPEPIASPEASGSFLRGRPQDTPER